MLGCMRTQGGARGHANGMQQLRRFGAIKSRNSSMAGCRTRPFIASQAMSQV